MTRLTIFILLAGLLSLPARAGGPLAVGGPGYGADGKAFVWAAAAMPIHYRVDAGPMSVNPAGTVIVNNAAGLNRVASMFQTWHNVATASIFYSYAGPILPYGAFGGGDVASVSQFDAVVNSCRNGVQNPIIFDASGKILAGLGLDNSVIGFTGLCKFDAVNGYISNAYVLMNGTWQDGYTGPGNGEITAAQFNEAITHEFGHFSGLDHSQINLQQVENSPVERCPTDVLAGLPLMFPYLYCQSRASAGLPTLAPDDVSWISRLYPKSTFASTYGVISGYILFSDGITHVQGVNVIARAVNNPATAANESLRVAVSAVSGYLFTGNPGQSLTAKFLPCSPTSACTGGYAGFNTGGSKFGTRNPAVIGYYEIAVPPGTYTVEVESISPSFTGGSSVGPLDPPLPLPGSPESWHNGESAHDNPQASDPITVSPGQTISNTDIILNGTPPRFDQFEDGLSDLQRGTWWLQARVEKRG